MKTNGLILGLISFGLLLLGLQAVLLPDSASIASGISVDEYIEQSNIQSINVEATANQARASRERHFAEKENSTLDWEMPSSLSSSGSTPFESRSMAQEQSPAEEAASSSPQPSTSAGSEIASNDTTMANASGSWSLQLVDSIQRDVSLALFQEGSSIFGSGSIREDNSTGFYFLLYNESGSLVLSKALNEVKSEIIPTQNLSQGIYFYRIQSEKTVLGRGILVLQ